MRKHIPPFFLFGAALALIACTGENKESGPPSGDPLEGIPKGKISVSCYDSLGYRNFLEDAAKLFMAAYPGTEVEAQSFSAMPEIRTSGEGDNMTVIVVQTEDDPRGRSDYINRVNTALMSGEGADIYAADILPFHTYAESGQLENLAVYMAGDPAWRDADFRANIIEAAKFRGGLWFMPADYGFNYFAYDTVLLPERGDFGEKSAFTVEALADRAKPRFEGGAKIFNAYDYVPGSSRGPGDMFSQLLLEYYPSLVDLENKKANFNDGTFAKILDLVKEYADAGYIPRSAASGPGEPPPTAPLAAPAAARETDRYFFKLNNNFSLAAQFQRGSGRRLTLRSAGSGGGITDDDAIAGIRANRDGGVPFHFSRAFGINRNSKNKGTAWEFLKFLLSDEVQGSLPPADLPLNNRAREEKAARLLSGPSLGREPDERMREAAGRYNAAVEALSDQINRYVPQDTVINDMIASEAAYFFRGTRTARETAAVLQNRVNLYLHE
ncbi:MAG: extracellular solute-binding protein [Treponema sp.]|jgi:multiple sugar transport system substrate-binding protein|nr:extracellular solute-binding protein [Treponema sp.]